MADNFIEFDKDNDTMISVDEMRAGLSRLGMSDADLAKGFVQGFRFISAH
jgi:Ca2+-binding EF-hand superfamily protein